MFQHASHLHPCVAAVDCPKCGAFAGEKCRPRSFALKGRKAEPHRDRIRSYDRLQAALPKVAAGAPLPEAWRSSKVTE